MEPSVLIAVLALISSLGGVVVANRYTARTAREAQETTAEIESKKLDASSWQEALKGWKDDVRQLREDRAEDAARYEADLAKLQGRVNSLAEELEAVNRARVFDRTQIDAMVAWGRIVVQMMRTAGIAYPPPPPGIQSGHTNPEGFSPIR